MSRFTWDLSVLLLLCFLVSAGGEDRVFPGNWDHPTVNVPEEVFEWKSGGYAFENDSLFILERLDNGGWLLIYLFTFRAPIGQKWGVIATLADSDGTRHFYKDEIPEKKIEYRKGSAYVRMGKSVFDGKAPSYRAHIELEGFVADLVFDNSVPTWMPGDGVTYYTSDKKVFYENSVILSFSRVTGTITYEGKTIDGAGWGYGDRAHSNLNFFRQNEIIYAVRGFPKKGDENKYVMSMLEYKAHRSYDGLRIPWIIIMNEKEFLVATKDYKLDVGDFRKDPNTGYTYPWRMMITGRDRDISFRLVSQARRIEEVLDVIDELPAYLRPIARKFFARPVFYRFSGAVTGVITRGDGSRINLDLNGYSEVTFVQKN